MNTIYTGISAYLYDLWFGQEPFEDQVFYQYFIEQKKGSALEIGSGTGRLLLPYLRDGLVVEGIEPSEDMIDLCLEKARSYGVKPIIHKQTMQDLELAQKYATIFIPLCSFQLLTDRDIALQTLKRLYNHLEDNGQLLISLFIPWIEPSGANQNSWRVRKSAIVPKKVTEKILAKLPKEHAMQATEVEVILNEALRNDTFEQIQVQRLKYEFYIQESSVINFSKFHDFSFFKTLKLRWYYRFEFQMMLEHIGFRDLQLYGDYLFSEAGEGTETYIWRAIK